MKGLIIMMQKYELDKNQLLLQNFLVQKSIDSEYTENNPFGYIYCIENKTNGKKYIGSVYSTMIGNNKPIPYTQLRKRASNYLYEYNRSIRDIKNAKQFLRPIILDMLKYGFKNFIMYPIAETNQSNHSTLEKYFISYYDTIKNGYNINPASPNMKKIGTRLMAKDKILRSEGIIAVNINKKELIFSDSMKLFGDFLNSSKDMIKNSNRKGRPYKGWFIFYIDDEKRKYVLYNNVINDLYVPTNEKHSEKAKNFYKELESIVDIYILYIHDFTKTEYFHDFNILDPLEYKD